MLYHRYSNPMTLLQQYINIGQFDRLVVEMLEIISEELKETTQWEYFLHKVYDQTFEEFMREIEKQSDEVQTADMNEIETTVKTSLQILDLFTGKA